MKDDTRWLSAVIREAAHDLERGGGSFGREQAIRHFQSRFAYRVQGLTPSTRPEGIFQCEEPGVILTRLRYAYEAKMNFEFFFFDAIQDSLSIKARYPSSARPVLMKDCSANLSHPRVMALFPENWHKDFRVEVETMPVYYFIDRFLKRHRERTAPLLGPRVEGAAFAPIQDVGSDDLIVCAQLWVYLHEYFHCAGALPFPFGLPYKATKEAGAFEELRVDLNAICEIPRIPSISARLAQMAQSYILAERLLHYASNQDPNLDYDAIASQMLFEGLVKGGILQINHGRIYLDEGVWPYLSQLKDEFNQIERDAARMQPSQAVIYFTNEVRARGGFREVDRRYEWIAPYRFNMDFLKSFESSFKKSREAKPRGPYDGYPRP